MKVHQKLDNDKDKIIRSKVKKKLFINQTKIELIILLSNDGQLNGQLPKTEKLCKSI